MLGFWVFITLCIAPLMISWVVRFVIWRDYWFVPIDVILSGFFLPFAGLYSWVIASKKGVDFRKKTLWRVYIIGMLAIFGIFLKWAFSDPSGWVLIFGGIIFISIALVSVGFSIWLASHLIQNPSERLTSRFRQTAIFMLTVLAALIVSTIFHELR